MNPRNRRESHEGNGEETTLIPLVERFFWLLQHFERALSLVHFLIIFTIYPFGDDTEEFPPCTWGGSAYFKGASHMFFSFYLYTLRLEFHLGGNRGINDDGAAGQR